MDFCCVYGPEAPPLHSWMHWLHWEVFDTTCDLNENKKHKYIKRRNNICLKQETSVASQWLRCITEPILGWPPQLISSWGLFVAPHFPFKYRHKTPTLKRYYTYNITCKGISSFTTLKMRHCRVEKKSKINWTHQLIQEFLFFQSQTSKMYLVCFNKSNKSQSVSLFSRFN